MSSSDLHTPHGRSENQLIGCLPAAVRALWEPHLESIDLELGQVTYEAGSAQSHV